MVALGGWAGALRVQEADKQDRISEHFFIESSGATDKITAGPAAGTNYF